MLANQIKLLVKCKTAMTINPIAMPTSLSSLVKRRKKEVLVFYCDLYNY